jgi:hypothetical protein
MSTGQIINNAIEAAAIPDPNGPKTMPDGAPITRVDVEVFEKALRDGMQEKMLSVQGPYEVPAEVGDMLAKLQQSKPEIEWTPEQILRQRIRELENICVDASVAIRSGMEVPGYICDDICKVAKAAEARQRDLTQEDDRMEQGLGPVEADGPESNFTIITGNINV